MHTEVGFHQQERVKSRVYLNSSFSVIEEGDLDRCEDNRKEYYKYADGDKHPANVRVIAVHISQEEDFRCPVPFSGFSQSRPIWRFVGKQLFLRSDIPGYLLLVMMSL